jgi:hypothetical protein
MVEMMIINFWVSKWNTLTRGTVGLYPKLVYVALRPEESVIQFVILPMGQGRHLDGGIPESLGIGGFPEVLGLT